MISTYHVILLSCKAYVNRPAIIDHLSAKNFHFVLHLLHRNLITIYTNTTMSFLPLQNLMGFLLQLTEMECYIQNWILVKIQLGIIYAHMVDFAGPVTYAKVLIN